MKNVKFSKKGVAKEEHKWLKKRREKRWKETKRSITNPEKDAVGLALSGGGIRSATFNLGLLQALEKCGILKCIDYMSTVSGGGYIGSCLTWLTAKLKKFPFGTKRKDHDEVGGEVLAWLRSHGKYLAPGEGLTIWALMGAVLTGVLINFVILIPFLLALFYLLSRKINILPAVGDLFRWFSPGNGPEEEIFFWLMILGVVCLGLFFVSAFVFSIMTRIHKFRKYKHQCTISRIRGEFLKYGIILFLVGSIPLVYHLVLKPNLGNWIKEVMSAVSITGIISMLFASRGPKDGRELKGKRSFFLSFGLSLIVYGLFLLFYHYAIKNPPFQWVLIALAISLFLMLFTDINHVSMHRYYRNRLMRAYMPDELEELEENANPDIFYLKDIEETGYPYHIINANIQTVGSKNPRLSSRGGDSFIFSPCFCGSESTDYVKTEEYLGGRMNLATAFAISGAAVDPNTSATRSRPLSFMMSLLNIRLGYWTRNPSFKKHYLKRIRPLWIIFMLREMFGTGLSEAARSIHLSDGGHFENLGLYELIRRKCKFIIVSDAGADKDWKFNDLAKVTEMVRLDFGADIDIDVSKLIPDEDSGRSGEAFVPGKVTYDDDTEADLLYIKTTVLADVKKLREDIYSYKRSHPDFPDQ